VARPMSSPKSHRPRLLAAFVVLALAWPATSLHADKRTKALSDDHRKWLEEEVVWIISKIERDVFLDLKTDAERDRFVQNFWDARDPTPGTPKNEFREEHYRRLDYANTKFREGGPGWRSDRGRFYIQLGPPAQVFNWEAQYQVHPVEQWFYSLRQHPSLPNNFYLLFWQREGAGPYKLYSPYNDGPERLVSAATFNDRRSSYEYLRGINAELARTTLTFFPNEPIDIDQLNPSMSSDLLIAQIYRAPEVEAPTHYLAQFLPADSKLREKVQTRYSFGFVPMQAAFLPFTDTAGNTLLHYSFHIAPKDLSIARYKDEYYAALQVTLNISDDQDKVLHRVSQDIVQYFSEAEMKTVQYQPMVFIDKVGIVPGHYKLDLLVYNKITGQTHQFGKVVDIPEFPAAAPAMSPLIAVESYRPVERTFTSLSSLAFSFFGYSFTPLLEKSLHPSEKLNILLQFYYPPDAVKANPGESLTLEYRFVPPGGAAEAKVITETVAKSTVNAAGCVLSFKQLPLTGVYPGRNTLVVAVKEPSGRTVASSNMNFTIDANVRRPPPRVAAAENLAADDSGVYDYSRAMLYFKLEKPEEAAAALTRAVLKSPDFVPALAELARLEFEAGRAERALELLDRARTQKGFAAESNILLARIYLKLGRKDDAGAALEAFLRGAVPSQRQYRDLAELYDGLGQPERAAAMRRQAGETETPR
jgi:GWxTD domain-containing protein